jgi:hypothetical protein
MGTPLRPTASLFVFSVTCAFFEQMLAKNLNQGYTAIVMIDHIGQPSRQRGKFPGAIRSVMVGLVPRLSGTGNACLSARR